MMVLPEKNQSKHTHQLGNTSGPLPKRCPPLFLSLPEGVPLVHGQFAGGVLDGFGEVFLLPPSVRHAVPPMGQSVALIVNGMLLMEGGAGSLLSRGRVPVNSGELWEGQCADGKILTFSHCSRLHSLRRAG